MSGSPTTPRPNLDVGAIIDVFQRHAVNFVVVGASAAEAAGVVLPEPTRDVDFTPADDDENLTRLSDAIDELGAGIRVDGSEPIPFAHNAASLSGVTILNLTCTAGDFDLVFAPTASDGYYDLIARATALPVGGRTVFVASLVDVIRSKREANRPKDRRVLPVLIRYAESAGLDVEQFKTLFPRRPSGRPDAESRPASVADARKRLADLQNRPQPKGEQHPDSSAPPGSPRGPRL